MVQFHPTRPIVATAGDDGCVKLWSSETFTPLFEWRQENAIRGIAFFPDGNRVIAGGREGVIHIYDIDTHDEIHSRTQPGAIFGIDYSPDGRLISTVGSDKVVRLWDAESLEERQTMMGHEGQSDKCHRNCFVSHDMFPRLISAMNPLRQPPNSSRHRIGRGRLDRSQAKVIHFPNRNLFPVAKSLGHLRSLPKRRRISASHPLRRLLVSNRFSFFAG
jgi:WD40 repeat protein